MTSMKDSFSDMFEGIELPSDEQVAKETFKEIMTYVNRERALNKNSSWYKANRQGCKNRSKYGKWLKENDPEEYKRYFGTVDNHKEETIAQMKVSATNRWKDEEQRKAQSERLKKPKKTIVCEHCNKEMSTSNYKKYRHHTGQCQVFTVMIDGIKYFNALDASKKLDIHVVTVRNRLNSKSKKFTEWQYIQG